MDTESSRIAFILDFDGTITQKDTISTIANFAIAFQKATGKDFADLWKELSDTYIEEYSRFSRGHKPAEQDRKTLAEEVSYYRNLKSIELASFARVSKSGIFKEISDAQWRKGGRDAFQKGDVNVRKGFEDFVKQVGDSKAIWGVVSVNFSSQFIRGVLEACLGAGAEEVEVLANHPDKDGILLGPNSGPVMATSDAKMVAMNELLQKWRSGSKTSFSKVVYIGDSGTDIECLTAEGVKGIVMSTDRESTLIDTLKRLGADLVHIGSLQEGMRSSVCWARDFEEVVTDPVFNLEAENEA